VQFDIITHIFHKISVLFSKRKSKRFSRITFQFLTAASCPKKDFYTVSHMWTILRNMIPKAIQEPEKNITREKSILNV